MRYLLDEQLDQVVALSMNPMGSKFGDEFIHILTLTHAGTLDTEIPNLCRDEGIGCIVTANVRDFGARKYHYQALLAENLHVAVLRPGRGKFYEEEQLALLSKSYRRIRVVAQEGRNPQLLACTQSGVRPRTIEELIEEFDRGKRLS